MPLPSTTTVDLDPPATPSAIQFCSANNAIIQPEPGSVLLSQRQWEMWNREFARVTYTTNTSGTGNVWRFENPLITNTVLTSSSATNSIYIDPCTYATGTIEIRGDLRVVPNDAFPWNPGIVLPFSAPSIPAQQFDPGIRGQRLTAEQRQRRLAENTAWLRAEQMLRQYLTREQRRELVRDQQFHIQVGERRYRIKKGRVGNIEWVDRAGEVLQRYCCHVRDQIPTFDNLLAQMLILVHNEPEFIRLANIHYRRDGIRHPFEIATPTCEAVAA